MSPEYISRPLGSYDPTEPMVIPYGDLIAARNAVTHLVTILRDPMDPPSDYQKTSSRPGCGSPFLGTAKPTPSTPSTRPCSGSSSCGTGCGVCARPLARTARRNLE